LIQAIQRPPTFRVYFPDGTLATILGGRRNPLAEALLARNNYDTYDGSIYNFLSFKITDYLKITTDFQFKLGHDHRNWFEPKVLNSGGFNSGGDRTDTDFYWISQTYLNFEKKFGNEHMVTAVAGFSADKTKETYQQIQGTNYVSEKITTANAIQSISLTDTGTGEERATTASFFGRVGYSFKGRYLFNANVRRDGSSRFGVNNRWGMFPGISAGWRFTDEPFMQWSRNVLDDGKLRVSYGRTGNNRIPFYASTQTYVFGENYYNGVSGIAPSGTFGNKDLGWETTTQFNAGLDLALWANRVNVVVDYYQKVTDDLLYKAPLPAETGFEDVNVNFGSIQNRGLEIGISGYAVDRGNFKWHAALNLTFNNDKVKTLSGGVPVTTENKWYLEEGGRLGNFYGWKYLGVYAYDESNAYTDDWQLLTLVTDSEGSIVRDGNGDPTYLLNNEPYSGNVNQLRSGSDIFKGGDVIFANHNRDGVIDDQDRVILGNAQPDYYLGINNTFTYKNFMLSFNFYVNWGNKVYDKARRDTYVMSPTNITPQPYFINNAWTHQGQVTDIWIARNYPRNLREINSYFIEDASFIRLRNVKLGYQIPQSIASKLHLKGLNAYVYGSNLVTWTNYKWFDPEVSVDNPLEMGLDSGAYPRKREIGFGINVSL
jgi:TonB-linked SusC/RagA family outer membrane protein